MLNTSDVVTKVTANIHIETARVSSLSAKRRTESEFIFQVSQLLIDSFC